MSESSVTDINEFFGALDAGLMPERLGVALTEIALNTCLVQELSGGKAKGKLTIKLDVACLSPDEGILDIAHEVVTEVPNKEGNNRYTKKGRTKLYCKSNGQIVECQPPENRNGQSTIPMEDG